MRAAAPLWIALTPHSHHLIERANGEALLLGECTSDAVRGRAVIIAPSAAKPNGMNYAARKLRELGAARVTVISNLPNSALDLADFIETAHANGRAVDLDEIALQVMVTEAAPITAPATADETTIARLAALPALEYDRVRIAEAERLGVRAHTLDDQVKRTRGDDDSDGKLMFAEVEPWPDPVDGERLLDSLSVSCRRFIVLPPHGDTALALWAMFTYLIEAAEVAPILAVISPEKRCGKTTCVEWLSRLVRRPMPASNISPAALFRSVEAWQPTLLVDEADTFLGSNDELRGILNSGHTRTTAYVVRTVGDDHEPKMFSTWGAKLVALIGKLPDTLQDRAIALELRRKLPSEQVEKLRHAEHGEFETLARQCVRFADDNKVSIRAARPEIPDELHDRAADNWEVLLAIADAAGGAWPRLARDAASVLSGASPDGDTTKTELLRDVRAVFERLSVDRIASAALVEALAEEKESRWAELYKGKPITQRQVARLLGAFGITPGTIRLPNGTTPRGYLLERFHDAFDRYIPLSQVQHRHNPILARVSRENASATEGEPLRIENRDKQLNDGACCGVADGKAGTAVLKMRRHSDGCP